MITNKNNKYPPQIFSFIFSVAFLVLLSPNAQACHPCPYGKTPGDQYCVNGNLYECRTCNNEPSCIPNANGVIDYSQPTNRCYVDPAHVPPSQLNWCDNSCPIGTPGIYDLVISSCTCPNDPPAVVTLILPNAGEVIADYNTTLAGRQVRLDWQTLADWGDDCNANDANDDFYEVEVTYNGVIQPLITKPRVGYSSEHIYTGGTGSYSWRVRADNGASKGTWSAPRTFRINTAPTAIINSPPASSTYTPARQLTAGVANTISVTINDVDANLNGFTIYARPVNSALTTWTGTATTIGTVTCTPGLSCTATRTFNPVLGTYYWIYIEARDALNTGTNDIGRCSGFPNGTLSSPNQTPPANHAYCGDSSRVLVTATATVAVQYIAFDASDVTNCSTLTAADVQARKIVAADVASSGLSSTLGVNYTTPQLFSGLVWNSAPTGLSFNVDGITYTPGLTARITLYSFTDPETFTNILSCAISPNGTVSGISVPDNIHVDFTMTSQPINTIYVGYKKSPTSWYTVQKGDVLIAYNDTFNGSSIIGKFPSTATTFSPYLLQNPNNVVYSGAGNWKITNILGNKAISSSGNAVNNIVFANNNLWPNDFSFFPPANFIQVGYSPSGATNYNTLTHGECTSAFLSSGVVKSRRAIAGNEHKPIAMNAACLYAAINATATSQTYDVGPGITVVYSPTYSGFLPTPPTISRSLRSVDPNSRLLILTNRVVNINTASTYSTVTPTLTDSSNIQLGIISSFGIHFNSVGGSNNTTVKAEGPLITSPTHTTSSTYLPSIRMIRQRTDNAYPAIIVDYNPTILRELTKQIRASTDKNPYGLSLVNLTWEIE